MNAREIVAALGGKWHGTYGLVRCPAHDDRNPSLRLRDGDHRLLVRCYSGCDNALILAELRRRGLLHDGGEGERDEEQLQEMVRRRAEQDKRERKDREAVAIAIWRASQPAVGTRVETYLKGRSITIAPPPTIHFHPALKHTPTGLVLPAMVAAVQGPDHKVHGVHRTFLTLDGTRKANVSDNKMSLGSISGGAVRLAKATEALAVGEGLETCLSFQQETRTPTWAALSASGMCSVVLPDLPVATRVIILVDRDDAGEQAAQATAKRLTFEGRQVTLARPTFGNDMNDALMGPRIVGGVAYA